MPTSTARVLLFAAIPSVLPAQDPEPVAPVDPAVVVAQGGGALTQPRTVFPIPEGNVRDHALVWTRTGLHVYVLWAKDDKTVELHHVVSKDKGRTFSPPVKLEFGANVRTKWVKAFVLDRQAPGDVALVLGSDPTLGPQTPRVTHFLGKKLQGFLGKIWVVRLGEDCARVESHAALRLENPGNMLYSHHPFRPAFDLVAHGERLTLTGTSVFYVRRPNGHVSKIWSLLAATAKDGETWSAISFRRKAYPGLNMLRPAVLHGRERVQAVFGDRFDKKLVTWSPTADGGWEESESDLGAISQWNMWYDAIDEGDALVVTDTVEVRKVEGKPRFGFAEFVSRDDGKTWKKRRVIDMDLAQAYAGYSYREGVTRAHVAWDVAALSVDDGRTWMKTGVPEAFRRGHSALIPSRGVVIGGVVKDAEAGKQALCVVIFSP